MVGGQDRSLRKWWSPEWQGSQEKIRGGALHTASPRGQEGLWKTVVCLPPAFVHLLDYSTLGFGFSAENHWRALVGEWPFYLFYVLKRPLGCGLHMVCKEKQQKQLRGNCNGPGRRQRWCGPEWHQREGGKSRNHWTWKLRDGLNVGEGGEKSQGHS